MQKGYMTTIIFSMDNTQKDQDIKELEAQIEKELLGLITEHLKSGELELEKAQALSQEFLDLLPFHDKAELLQKLGTLSPRYAEAQAVYAKYGGDIEKQESSEKVAEMTEHIKNGQIEEAINVAKGEN